jgi:4-alpha-glucanotransferase
MSNQESLQSTLCNEPRVQSAPLYNWLQNRSSGVLLHPTSLPGDQGIGVLDGSVDHFLDFLKDSSLKIWQVCPLGPTGYGDSPYQCFSAFAANPYLIDLVALVHAGLLQNEDLCDLRKLPRDRINYGWLYVTKWPILFKAHAAAKTKNYSDLPYGDFTVFRSQHSDWLDAYSLFLALKDHHQGEPWWLWPDEHRFYALTKSVALPASVLARSEAHSFFQYLVYGQWNEVRAKAFVRKISLVGDAPIFVARDSADVWMQPELFQIDQHSGLPLAVAGVPPDYFSTDGQLWGNPLYDWEKHSADGYNWWIKRLRANFSLYDIVRLDHFRAFDTYWSIPADAKTAKQGEWKQGPGLSFFKAVKVALPDAKLIAEDLGDLFESVRTLRDACGLPGMSILQFAFGGDATNLYLPHNHVSNAVIYPGTHDNNTSLGWYQAATAQEQAHARRYLRIDGSELGWDFIRAAYASVSRLAITPLQDFMNLGGDSRFNTPGVANGNWQWRYSAAQLDHLRHHSADYLHYIAGLYNRC